MSDDHEDGRPRPEPRLRRVARRLLRELDFDGGDHDAPHEPHSAEEPSPQAASDEQPEAPRREGGRKNSGRREGPRKDGPRKDGPRKDGPRGDTWALLGALLETGDKAKTEMVKMLGREVRTYLEALELHKDLHHIVTHYSLEVQASIHLKPLGDTPPPPSASVGLAPRSAEAPAPPHTAPPKEA